MFEAMAMMLAAVAVQPVPAPPSAAAQPADGVAGRWQGTFTGADWTFEFRREEGRWTGRYITTKGKNWHPLLDLAIADGAVTFAIESTPKVTFRLKLDRTTDTLAGDVDIGGFHTLPFAAARAA